MAVDSPCSGCAVIGRRDVLIRHKRGGCRGLSDNRQQDVTTDRASPRLEREDTISQITDQVLDCHHHLNYMQG